MSRYNNNNAYGPYYGPVGSSQSNQSQGYTQQSVTTPAPTYPSAAMSTYSANNNNSYAHTYGNQQYGTAASDTTDRAAAALSSLSSQSYTQPRNSDYTNYSSDHNASSLRMPNRAQSNHSPLYPTQASSSTFGRLSVPAHASSSSSSAQSYQSAPASAPSLASNRSYQTAYTQPTQQQPPRYHSPLHAVQAQQHGYPQQSSLTSNHQLSSHISAAQNVQQSTRQQSASVEPSPMTVNPSQVYDNRAELERQAQVEAERRRRREEQEAARRAEEERERLAEQKREEEEEATKKFEEEVAEKKATNERTALERKKAKEERQQSKSAATALQKMATSGSVAATATAAHDETPPANNEEREMREMFKKMREFNARNPAMLAKMWEEERRSHTQSQSPQRTSAVSATNAMSPTQQKDAANSSVGPKSTANGAQQPVTAFQKPVPPAPSDASSKTKVQLSSNPQATPTLWPPHKKDTLAEAAARWLSSQRANADKLVVKDNLFKILDSNPSYVQLCEALEGQGLKFERSLLARELLRAVPDGLKAQPPAQSPAQSAQQRNNAPLSTTSGSAPQVNGSAPAGAIKPKGWQPKVARDGQENHMIDRSRPSNGIVDYQAPASSSLADTARKVNSMDKIVPGVVQGGSYQSPYQPPPNGSSRAPSQSQTPQPPAVKPEVKPPEEPLRPPANKEEAARKRTFNDLVDLTQGDSDDDTGPPKRMMFHPSGQGPTLMRPSTYQVQNNKPASSVPGGQQRPSSFLPPPQPGQQAPTHAPQPLPNGQAAAVLARPPLPPPPPVKPKGPSPEQLQQERIKGKMLVEPMMRDRAARKSNYDPRTIARDVLLATGRHPDMRGLNAHLGVMQRLLGEHGGMGYDSPEGVVKGARSDLSTVRWDIIDPGSPKASVVAKVRRVEKGEIGVDDGDDEGEGGAEERPMAIRHAIDNGDGTMRYVYVQEQQQRRKQKQPRSQPPAARYPAPVGATPVTNGNAERIRERLGGLDATVRTRTPSHQQQRPVGTPSSAPTAGSDAPVGYAAFRQYDENGNVIKKKGRPFGWKKDVHSRAAHGLPSKNPATLPDRRHKSQTKPTYDDLIEAHFQVYRCRWLECKAELHNLETLRKHVVKTHGRRGFLGGGEGMFHCLWRGCQGVGHGEGREKSGKGKEKARSGPAMFEEIEEWMGHVDRMHLQPVAWKLGDGPKGGLADHHDSASEAAYLSDAQGRSVTPVIRVQSEDTPATDVPGTATVLLPAAAMPAEATGAVPTLGVRTAGAGRPPNDPKAGRVGGGSSGGGDGRGVGKAAKELRGLVDHKRAVGPTMERTGSVLPNEKRRRGFLDDEDFEDEIEVDEVEEEEEEEEEEEGEEV